MDKIVITNAFFKEYAVEKFIFNDEVCNSKYKEHGK